MTCADVIFGTHTSDDLICEVLTGALTAVAAEPAVGIEEPLRVLFHHLGAQQGYLKTTALLEWHYWEFIQRSTRPHALYRWISSDPDGFVELLRASSLGKVQVVLHSLRTPPDDPEAWLARARELTTDDPEVRRYVEHFAGKMLAGAAADEDGRWPAAGVTRLLETAESDDLLEGYAMGLALGWGSARSLYSGGEQEREMIAKLRVYADGVRNRRPRVSKAIEGAMGFFETVARHHDDSAENTQDEY